MRLRASNSNPSQDPIQSRFQFLRLLPSMKCIASLYYCSRLVVLEVPLSIPFNSARQPLPLKRQPQLVRSLLPLPCLLPTRARDSWLLQEPNLPWMVVGCTCQARTTTICRTKATLPSTISWLPWAHWAWMCYALGDLLTADLPMVLRGKEITVLSTQLTKVSDTTLILLVTKTTSSFSTGAMVSCRIRVWMAWIISTKFSLLPRRRESKSSFPSSTTGKHLVAWINTVIASCSIVQPYQVWLLSCRCLVPNCKFTRPILHQLAIASSFQNLYFSARKSRQFCQSAQILRRYE